MAFKKTGNAEVIGTPMSAKEAKKKARKKAEDNKKKETKDK